MDRLMAMRDKAISIAEEGLNQDVSCIDAKELGEIVDIVKDLEEAIYYRTITEAMEESSDREKYLKRYVPEVSK